jgi:hypothetical protein
MALFDLKAILTLVCLNRLVILRMCGEVKGKVAHFGLFSFLVVGCGAHCSVLYLVF